MLFNSFAFLFLFLPVALAGYFALGRRSPALAGAFLTLMSLLFYGVWDVRNVPILVISIVLNFLCVQLILRSRGGLRRTVMGLGVAGNLAALGYYKYADFLASALDQALSRPHQALHVTLPLGISFFTFTQIAFLVDVARNKASETRPGHYALFVTYFPHLIAGPVLHHAEMMPQFRNNATYRVQWPMVASGINLFVLGLAKKVLLADMIAPQANAGFAAAAHGGMAFWPAWVAAFSYGWQIYFDFSGYSDMAVGLSRLFGVELPLNFASPYQARSIIEFWRRWHMSLSRFLRDYLYIPLGGGRAGKARRYLNLMITMVLGGLWHGAGWHFALWGALHGAYLMMNHAWRALAERLNLAALPKALRQAGCMAGWAMTLLAAIVAFIPFRAGSIVTSWRMLQGMIARNGVGVLPLHDAALCVGLGVLALAAPNSQTLVAWLDRPLAAGRLPAWPAALLALAAVLFLWRPAEFLYFQF